MDWYRSGFHRILPDLRGGGRAGDSTSAGCGPLCCGAGAGGSGLSKGWGCRGCRRTRGSGLWGGNAGGGGATCLWGGATGLGRWAGGGGGEGATGLAGGVAMGVGGSASDEEEASGWGGDVYACSKSKNECMKTPALSHDKGHSSTRIAPSLKTWCKYLAGDRDQERDGLRGVLQNFLHAAQRRLNWPAHSHINTGPGTNPNKRLRFSSHRSAQRRNWAEITQKHTDALVKKKEEKKVLYIIVVFIFFLRWSISIN